MNLEQNRRYLENPPSAIPESIWNYCSPLEVIIVAATSLSLVGLAYFRGDSSSLNNTHTEVPSSLEIIEGTK